MYDDTQATSTGMDQIANDIDDKQLATLGLGTNPSTVATAVPATSQVDSTAPATPTKSDEEIAASETQKVAAAIAATPAPVPAPEPVEPAPIVVSDQEASDLLDIKKQALSHLAPLVDKLEQTPEEHYKTLMMVIQASDDQSLIKKAYEAASSIEDENARAQALLAVINEINYFTQPPEQS